MERLRNKVAIVTGGGSGIGRATAIRLAAEGAKVMAADISDLGARETRRLITKAGGNAISLRADVTKAADMERMTQDTVQAFGAVHILINNAGIYSGEDKRITEIDEAVFDRVLDINLKGMFLAAKYAFPQIAKSGGGASVMVSSIGGVSGGFVTAYGTSKGGVISLMRSLAGQYGHKNIRVNAILPGPIDTPIHEGVNIARGQPPHSRQFGKTPMITNRWGKPEDVAALIAFLVSDDASFMTGAALTIDGGSTGL